MEPTSNEISRLRGCINDLISVLAIPAMWSGQELAQIVGTLLDALLGMLRLDFAYARLKVFDRRGAHRDGPARSIPKSDDPPARDRSGAQWLVGR